MYDDVDLEDMSWDIATKSYSYQCPCGDFFAISLDDLQSGEEIATCPSCTLVIRVVYDPDDLSDDGSATVRCFEIGDH